LSSSYSKQPTPSRRSRSIHPRHLTQTPFIMKCDLRCTCKMDTGNLWRPQQAARLHVTHKLSRFLFAEELLRSSAAFTKLRIVGSSHAQSVTLDTLVTRLTIRQNIKHISAPRMIFTLKETTDWSLQRIAVFSARHRLDT
jgi:hypothetical protein